jgi:hypothetical protein
MMSTMIDLLGTLVTDPTIWKDSCEMYFKIYEISKMMKVKFAMLNFVGNAAL